MARTKCQGAKGRQKPWFCPGAVPEDLALTCPGQDTWLLAPSLLPACLCVSGCPAPPQGWLQVRATLYLADWLSQAQMGEWRGKEW